MNASQYGSVILLNGRLGATVLDAAAVVGSAGHLTANAGGYGALTYAWRKGGVPLSDGGTVSGRTRRP